MDIYSTDFLDIEILISGSGDETALILAAEREKWDIVDILVKRGADVNVKGEEYVRQFSNHNTAVTGSSGQTALIMAAEKGKLDIVSVLINAGADVNEKFGEIYFQQIFRILNSPFQVRPMKRHLSLPRRMGTGALSNFSSSVVLM